MTNSRLPKHPTEDTPTPQGGLEQPKDNSQSVTTKSLPSTPSKPDVVKAVLELQEALYYHLIKLEFIKVDRLPIIDGNEVTHICGVPLRTHIYEDEADFWRHTAVTDLAENGPETTSADTQIRPGEHKKQELERGK